MPLLAIPAGAILLPNRGGTHASDGGCCSAGACLAVPARAQTERPPITSVSHLAVYTSDPAKAEAFYIHDLGAVKRSDPENPAGTRYYFSPVQFVEVLPLPASAGLNRLDHAAFNVGNAEAMRLYLHAEGIAVPAAVTTAKDGSRWFQVKDPEGVAVEFVQPPAKRPRIAGGGLSSHIIHVGFVIHDRKREDSFYRDVLGFKPYWFGGMKDDTPTWISQQVPTARIGWNI
jgi:catechol 2,3-dioxygenase-like lactoylglutathione lyase family enzyme